jgi:hypothetical protein
LATTGPGPKRKLSPAFTTLLVSLTPTVETPFEDVTSRVPRAVAAYRVADCHKQKAPDVRRSPQSFDRSVADLRDQYFATTGPLLNK